MTLVVAPGNYRFLDFVRVGVPLLLLAWMTTLLVTPLFFPSRWGAPSGTGPQRALR